MTPNEKRENNSYRLKYLVKDILKFRRKVLGMWPRAKKYGLKYFWSKSFRNLVRHREDNKKYGSLRCPSNRKRIRYILLRNNNSCFWCGYIFKKTDKITIDHILPVSQGGDNKLTNLRLIHDDCRVIRDRMIEKGELQLVL